MVKFAEALQDISNYLHISNTFEYFEDIEKIELFVSQLLKKCDAFHKIFRDLKTDPLHTNVFSSIIFDKYIELDLELSTNADPINPKFVSLKTEDESVSSFTDDKTISITKLKAMLQQFFLKNFPYTLYVNGKYYKLEYHPFDSCAVYALCATMTTLPAYTFYFDFIPAFKLPPTNDDECVAVPNFYQPKGHLYDFQIVSNNSLIDESTTLMPDKINLEHSLRLLRAVFAKYKLNFLSGFMLKSIYKDAILDQSEDISMQPVGVIMIKVLTYFIEFIAVKYFNLDLSVEKNGKELILKDCFNKLTFLKRELLNLIKENDVSIDTVKLLFL